MLLVWLVILISLNALILLWINLREARIERYLERVSPATTWDIPMKLGRSQRREVETLENSRKILKRLDRILKRK